MNNRKPHLGQITLPRSIGILVLSLIAVSLLFSLVKFSEHPKSPTVFEDLLTDYIHEQGINAKFRAADSLKLCRQYRASTAAFLSHIERDTGEDLAYGLNQIISNYLVLNQLQAASRYMELFDSRLGEQQLSIGASGDYHLNKGILEQHTGQGQSSIAHLKQAVSHYDKIYPPDHQKKIQALNELGLSYCFYSTETDSFFRLVDSSYHLLNRHPKLIPYNARVYYGQAHKCWYKKDHVTGENFCKLAIKHSLGIPDYDTLFVAQNYAFRGRMLNKQKNQDSEVLAFFLEAIDIGSGIQRREPRIQLLYDEIIKYFAFKSDSANFEQYLGRVQSAYSPDELVYIFPDRLRGYYNHYAGNSAEAAFYYKRFLESYLKRTRREVILLPEALTVIIESSLQFDQLEEAETYVWEMIKVFLNDEIDTTLPFKELYSSTIFSGNYLYTSLDYIARIYKRRHELKLDSVASLEKAFHLYTLMDTVIYDNIESFDEDAWLRFSRSYNERIYQSAIETAFLLYQQKKEVGILDWANHFIDRLKAPLLYQELLIKQSETFAEVPESIFQQERELNRQIREQKQDKEARDEEWFAELVGKREVLYQQLKNKYPRYYKAKIHQPFVGATDLQNALTDDREAIVNFSYGRHYLYTLTIHRDTILFERKEKAQEIDSSIQWLNNYFLADNKFKTDQIRIYQDSAYSLFKTLFGHLEHHLPELDAITIIPAGNLNFTAFDALITAPKADGDNPKTLHYLCKKYEIKYAFSAKAYLHQQLHPFKLGPDPKVLAYAYADQGSGFFGNSKSSELPATAKELDAISEFLPSAQEELRYGKRSKKTHFLNSVDSGYDIYHFALHAYANSGDRLENFLLFPQDTIYGYEIISMNLGGQLAILSSCETASGSYEPGEGQYSLTRSFFLAGCNNIVSSLWQAEDNNTADLIRYFYYHLSQGKSPSKALNLAKLDFLDQAEMSKAHPFYWANFVCYG